MRKRLLDRGTGRILSDSSAGSCAIIIPLILTWRFNAAGTDRQLKKKVRKK